MGFMPGYYICSKDKYLLKRIINSINGLSNALKEKNCAFSQ